jgi:hypothetical protein
MGRKIKAIDAATGEPIEVDPDKIKSGRIRNPSLSESLLIRVRDIHSRIKHVYDVNFEQFEITFMRDSDPEGEGRNMGSDCRWVREGGVRIARRGSEDVNTNPARVLDWCVDAA